MSEDITVERGHVATVTLNRPDKLNAMAAAMDGLLNDLVFDLNNDAAVRVIVLTCAGDRACSGSHINDLDSRGSNWEHRNRLRRPARLRPFRLVAAQAGHRGDPRLLHQWRVEMACASDIRTGTPAASLGARARCPQIGDVIDLGAVAAPTGSRAASH